MKINYDTKKGLLIIGASGHGKVVADVALKIVFVNPKVSQSLT